MLAVLGHPCDSSTVPRQRARRDKMPPSLRLAQAQPCLVEWRVLLGTEMAAGGMDSSAVTVENSLELPPQLNVE